MEKNLDFEHIMLDIETMGSQSNSAIVSIGAVKFDLRTGNMGESFYELVDLQSCLDVGLQVNGGTIKCWFQKNEAARNEISLNENKLEISNALCKFSEFCSKDHTIWANSPRFDCGIMQDAYNMTSLEIPWDFRKERDVRTLVSFNPEIKKEMVENWDGVLHNPVDDCRLQISYCCEIMAQIKIL